jgi:hypothetical protein
MRTNGVAMVHGASVAAILIGTATLLSPVVAGEARFDCGACIAGLESMPVADRELICRATVRVQDFFAGYGIDPGAVIRVGPAEEGSAQTPRHLGLYDLRQRRITLLPYEHARRRDIPDMLFGQEINAALYVSVVAHELAHAIADQHFRQRPAPLVAQEYIAYTAQLSTLESGIRREILSRSRRTAFADIDEMSTTYYALDPSGFGIKAFLHFRQLDDPGAFLRGLLSGEIYSDSWDNEL